MYKPDETKIAKLPKWARDHINLCHRNLESMEKQVRQIVQGPEGGKVRLVRFVGDMEDQPLPDRTIVSFELPGGPRRNWIEFRLDEEAIRVMGSDTIAIYPHAANTVSLVVSRL